MKTSLISTIFLPSLLLFLPGCDTVKAKYYELTGQQSAGEASQEQLAEGQGEAANGEAGHAEHEHAEGEQEEEEGGEEERKIVVTNPLKKDVITTQRYVCQIHSRRHIEIAALEGGYLEEINVKEGQTVKQGDVIFEIYSVLYEAKLAADLAEAKVAEIEYRNTQTLYEKNNVSQQMVLLAEAKLAKARANVDLTRAELAFTEIKAPFDGIVGQQLHQQGSLIEEGDVLTTMSDNDVMWVYFNVPEARYLEYKRALAEGEDQENLNIELVLANHEKFAHPGKIAAIEADFNNMTGNIRFRADFPNPDALLRYGQTGTILIHRDLKDAIVIPQRATFEILAKKYAYVVGEDNIVHQRDIVIQNELDDIYVIKDGLKANEKIIFEGILQVRDGVKVEYEYRAPEEILNNLKHHAE